MNSPPTRTRDRIVAEAMRLFAQHGYAGTSVASIEAAAGLSAGSGGLYKHFASKRAVLAEGVARLIGAGGELSALLGPAPGGGDTDPRRLLEQIARAGLRRLEHERDFNRVLVRDLAAFPDLLALARDDEIARNHRALTAWLAAHAGGAEPAPGWAAVAAVLIGATAHFWLLRDIFGGEHPTGVTEDEYVAALGELAVRLVGPAPPPRGRHGGAPGG
jgi:AcrR family transcriptional regulator